MNDTTSSALHKATKHTSGPWEVIDRSESGSIRSAISDKISAEDFPFEINMPSPPFALGATGALVARKSGIGTREGSAEANAHLIAAAPELLEAAQLAANILFLLWPEVEQLGLNAKNVPEILGRAIAKAEGK